MGPAEGGDCTTVAAGTYSVADLRGRFWDFVTDIASHSVLLCAASSYSWQPRACFTHAAFEKMLTTYSTPLLGVGANYTAIRVLGSLVWA